jgi:hypothetical protein
MRWLLVGSVGALGFLVTATLTTPGCSNSDNPPAVSLGDASQPGPTSAEAGANCKSTENCNAGLVCLYPVSACSALPVCTVPPPSPCDHPQTACSCLGEVIQVCDGYASDPVDVTSTCDGGVVVVPTDSGSDGGGDATVPPSSDAGTGADAAIDAPAEVDASDAAGE